jgi:hypothetical protein
MWSYLLIFPLYYWCANYGLKNLTATWHPFLVHIVAIVVAYLPTYVQTSSWSLKDGRLWKPLQYHRIWKRAAKYFRSSISVEGSLNHSQLYIFGAFPHGACSINHFITMTDCHGMLTKHYKGERRDLAASVLFLIPIVKEV